MNQIKIKKAKIKDAIFLDVEFIEELPGHSKKDTKLSCTVPIHDDLKHSIDKLHVHLAVLCDEVKAPKKSELETITIEKFEVIGFAISGSDENEGVKVIGSKDGKYGIVNLNTPIAKYADSEYPFISELTLDIEAALYEITQYLFEGKRAPEKQMELTFGEDQ